MGSMQCLSFSVISRIFLYNLKCSMNVRYQSNNSPANSILKSAMPYHRPWKKKIKQFQFIVFLCPPGILKDFKKSPIHFHEAFVVRCVIPVVLAPSEKHVVRETTTWEKGTVIVTPVMTMTSTNYGSSTSNCSVLPPLPFLTSKLTCLKRRS